MIDAEDCPTLYLILQIANYVVGVTGIVNMALMQDRLNIVSQQVPDRRKPFEKGFRDLTGTDGRQAVGNIGESAFWAHLAIHGEYDILDAGHQRLEVSYGLIQ